jgi:hypothetical protein
MRPHFRLMSEPVGRRTSPTIRSCRATTTASERAKIIKARDHAVEDHRGGSAHPAGTCSASVNNCDRYLEHPHVKESRDRLAGGRVGRLPVANIPGLPPASDTRRSSTRHIGEDGLRYPTRAGLQATEAARSSYGGVGASGAGGEGAE